MIFFHLTYSLKINQFIYLLEIRFHLNSDIKHKNLRILAVTLYLIIIDNCHKKYESILSCPRSKNLQETKKQ